MTLEQGMIVVITSLASALIIIWKRLSDNYDKMEKRHDALEKKVDDCEGDKRELWRAVFKLQGLTCTKFQGAHCI
jgi:hypothetical protein